FFAPTALPLKISALPHRISLHCICNHNADFRIATQPIGLLIVVLPTLLLGGLFNPRPVYGLQLKLLPLRHSAIGLLIVVSPHTAAGGTF
ncbi:unnamed protein product, partial [Staurois parvus]